MVIVNKTTLNLIKIIYIFNYKEMEWENDSSKQINEIKDSVRNISNVVDSNEKFEAINDNLSRQQKESIWSKYLEYETMTVWKITVIGYMLSAEDIKDIWAKKLALMDIKELNELTKKYM